MILFTLCLGLLYGISSIYNISYQEASVYVNLYIQYIVLAFSCFMVLINKLKQFNFTVEKITNLLLAIIYNCLIICLGFWLYSRYFTIDISNAYELCLTDLQKIVIDIMPYPIYNVVSSMVVYAYLNILIFVIGFIGLLIFNEFWKFSWSGIMKRKKYIFKIILSVLSGLLIIILANFVKITLFTQIIFNVLLFVCFVIFIYNVYKYNLKEFSD